MRERPPGKCCKVITTCFIGREIREATTFCGSPPGPFDHSQNFPTPESVIELLAYIVQLERTVDPGVECDTVIVNNDVGFEPGARFLAEIDGARTFAGRLRVLTSGNYGRSFGGRHHAYERFRSEYDHWLFTEDDILILGDRYFKVCLETYYRRADTGFVAIQGLSDDESLHAHGGVGALHVGVLHQLHARLGKLPHCGADCSQDYQDIVTFGEVAFSSEIINLGYRIVPVKSPTRLYAYAYDHMRGIEVPDLSPASRLWWKARRVGRRLVSGSRHTSVS
jgi:hypothetical protein